MAGSLNNTTQSIFVEEYKLSEKGVRKMVKSRNASNGTTEYFYNCKVPQCNAQMKIIESGKLPEYDKGVEKQKKFN